LSVDSYEPHLKEKKENKPYEPHLKEKKEKKPYGKFTNIKEHHILSLPFCISRLQKTQCTSDN
jgi:hypothetical protein